MPKAKLQYGDDNQIVPSSMYQTNAILQSQQFTKLANMFYGLENTSSALSNVQPNRKVNTVYSTGDQRENYDNDPNDSVIYSIVNEDPIIYPSHLNQLQGSE